jgi:type I pantothenate kinase
MDAPSFVDALSPYRTFSRAEWAALRADTPLTLGPEELKSLQSMNDRISVDEVVDIYLPLSRLLALYVAATQELFRATERFLGAEGGKVPYIIAIAGSVAAGKSTLSRILTTLLSRWDNTPKVQLLTTDGFLLPNSELLELGLMEKKGFPESYDTSSLLRFLSKVKAGEKSVDAPLYSHLLYDVISDKKTLVDSPDILIVEGLNVLQAPPPTSNTSFVSDYFDFSIYLDADKETLGRWYVARFMKLRETAFRNPNSYFKKYATLSDEEARATALDIWTRINLRNLEDNILPTKQRASLILTKDDEHRISKVALRRL